MRDMATENNDDIKPRLGELTADIVSAYVGNNAVPAALLPELIANIHGALSGASSGATTEPEEHRPPAVPIRRSVSEDAISCLYCGKAFKTIKRHIRSNHDMTPEQYRAKWGLKPDYPMTAPGYAKSRSALAKKMGLGRKRKSK